MFKKMSLFLAALLALGAVSCQNPTKDVRTVILTGNYQKPRLLADVLQNESNQPYILLPNEAEPRIMFVPGKRTGAPSCEIPPHKFAQRVALLGPTQIIILGDENYVPKKYEDALTATSIPVVRMRGSDWKAISKTCQSMMNLSYASRDYSENYNAMLNRSKKSSGVLMSDETSIVNDFSEPGVVRTAPTIKVEETTEVKPIVEIKEEPLPAPEPIFPTEVVPK